MNKKEIIKNLYFEEKKTLTQISQELNITVGYISRILKEDEKYLEEKQRRIDENLVKRRKMQKEKIYQNRKKKGIDVDYIALQNLHEQASRELSKSRTIGTEALRKWCNSAYKYNANKRRYEFDAGNSAKSVDLPQYIKV